MNNVSLPRLNRAGSALNDPKFLAENGQVLIVQSAFSGQAVVELLTHDAGKHGASQLLRGKASFAALSPVNKFALVLVSNGVYAYALEPLPRELNDGARIQLKDLAHDEASALAVSDDGIIAVGTKAGVVRTYMPDGYPIHDEKYVRMNQEPVSTLAFHGNRHYVVAGRTGVYIELS